MSTPSDSNTRSPSLSPTSTPKGSSNDLAKSLETNPALTSPSISHRRSQSAELVDNPDLLLDPRFSASLTEPLNMKEARAQQMALEANTSPLIKNERSSSQGSMSSLKKQNNNNTVQQIPSKLAVSSTSVSPPKGNKPKNVLPLNLAETKKLSSKDGGSKSASQKKDNIFYF